MFTKSIKLFFTFLICLSINFSYAQWFALPDANTLFSGPNYCNQWYLPQSIQPVGNGRILFNVYCYNSPSSGGGTSVHYTEDDLSSKRTLAGDNGIGCCNFSGISSNNDSTICYAIGHYGSGTGQFFFTKNNFLNTKIIPNGNYINASCIVNKYIYYVGNRPGASFYSCVYDTAGVLKLCSTKNLYKPYYSSLQFQNDSTGYTLATYTSNISKTTLLKTNDYGANWLPVLIDSVNAIMDYHLLPNGAIYLCKKNGQIQRSIDAGATWATQSTATPLINYNAIRFISDSVGYLAGANGILLKTLNYGVTWLPETIGTTIKIDKLYNFGSVVYCVDSAKRVFKNQPLLVGVTKNYSDENKISVYPNPTSSKIIVELNNKNVREKIHIFNFLGEEIKSLDFIDLKTELDLSDQPLGIYILKMGLFTKKIIKN